MRGDFEAYLNDEFRRESYIVEIAWKKVESLLKIHYTY